MSRNQVSEGKGTRCFHANVSTQISPDAVDERKVCIRSFFYEAIRCARNLEHVKTFPTSTHSYSTVVLKGSNGRVLFVFPSRLRSCGGSLTVSSDPLPLCGNTVLYVDTSFFGSLRGTFKKQLCKSTVSPRHYTVDLMLPPSRNPIK